MKSITLVGYMCVGKTTVGRAIARKLGISFYDLDWYIEERFHTRIPDIFRERGEAAFRDMERRMLHEAAEFEDIVLSAGGGTPCFFDNMSYLNRQGQTIYLKAQPEVLYSHLKMGKVVRPLLLNKTPDQVRAFIKQQLAQREKYYSQAHHTIDVSLLDNREKIKITVETIKKLLNI